MTVASNQNAKYLEYATCDARVPMWVIDAGLVAAIDHAAAQ